MTARQLIWSSCAGTGPRWPAPAARRSAAHDGRPRPAVAAEVGDRRRRSATSGGPSTLDAADVRKLADRGGSSGHRAGAARRAYAGDLWLKRAGERIAHDLRVAMYAHLQRLSLAFHDRRQKGDLVARLTGTSTRSATLFSDILGTMAQAVLVLAGCWSSALIDPLLGLAMLRGRAPCSALSVHYRRQVRARRAQAAQARGRDRLAGGGEPLGDARRQGLRRRALRGRARRASAPSERPHRRLGREPRGAVRRRRRTSWARSRSPRGRS